MSDLRELSIRLERKTGADSIPTIERMYEDGGSLLCIFPDCGFRRRDPVAMWHHVHFGRTHGLTFGWASPDVAARRVLED